jgi:branched-chain amino acid transport system ATP-binding protein
MIILETKAINTFYGLSHILHDVSLKVKENQVVSLLGRNGAGKTTVIRSIMGLTPPRSGTILFKGETISGLKSSQIFIKGIKIIPQGRGIFPSLSVEENLRLAMVKAGIENPQAELKKVYDLFPFLAEKRRQKGQYLSGGQLQMLAISRVLLGTTSLILMDEPTEGLAPLIVQQVGEVIREIKKGGCPLVLAEQNLKMAMELGDWHYIIDNGIIKYQGTSEEIRNNEELKNTYLGVGREYKKGDGSAKRAGPENGGEDRQGSS